MAAFVKLVRTSSAAGRMCQNHFVASVDYIHRVYRNRWQKTRCFGSAMPNVDFPSYEAIIAPPPSSGEKRHLNKCSFMTEAFNQPPHKAAFCMSSPNPEGRASDAEEPMDNDTAAKGGAQRLPPALPPK